MKRILAVIALTFTGCASTQKVQSLADQIVKLNSEVVQLIAARDARDKQIGGIEQVLRTNYVELKSDSHGIGNLLQDRIENLEAFKADHDKRWPPPVKLKAK